ncbi:plasmid related protein [Achromobacter xylosoxidans]|uniref:plasmid related protein n=1 Tax=Alcaligenes xylosoxydans xylosoxydans TaxID=85698 RepID=UPI0023680C63|nr:plasmid related protein [Achromobacter xylosoxidans]MDD7990728.1 plasmid related protein [Achromobacter xylosoxidans]
MEKLQCCTSSSTTERRGLRIPLGQVVATPGALGLLQRANLNPFQMLLRHRSGDWGDVHPEDALANEAAAIHGHRVISTYEAAGERLWIITEADRSSTTLLLPGEY